MEMEIAKVQAVMMGSLHVMCVSGIIGKRDSVTVLPGGSSLPRLLLRLSLTTCLRAPVCSVKFYLIFQTVKIVSSEIFVSNCAIKSANSTLAGTCKPRQIPMPSTSVLLRV